MDGFTVGVDLGGTNARAARVELATGRIVDEAKRPVGAHDPEAVADLVASLVAEVDPDGARRGVGIGFAGMLRGATGVVANAPNFGWREVDFGELLRARLGPGPGPQLYNDLSAITWGETTWGAARGARHVLCVFVGTGIGGGLVTDGKLYTGSGGIAGEIGHTKVVPGGRMCGCGQRGCLEAYAGGRHIAERAQEALRDQPGAAVVKLAGAVEKIHAGHVDTAAAAGDPWAGALWDEVAALLGMVLANAVTLLNPERLVMGGGVWERAPELRRRVEASYRQLVNAPSGETCTLLQATLGDHAGILGAAGLIALSDEKA